MSLGILIVAEHCLICYTCQVVSYYRRQPLMPFIKELRGGISMFTKEQIEEFKEEASNYKWMGERVITPDLISFTDRMFGYKK